MRAIITFAMFLIGTLLFTSPSQAAGDSTCVATCADAGAAASGLLDMEFNTFIGKNTYIAYCNANPKGPNLFDGDPDSQAGKDARLKEYCNFSPAFRMCFVCERLKNKKNPKTFKNSLDACQGLLNPKNYQDFLNNVVKPRNAKHAEQETQPAEGGATTDAT